jgi:tRNA threonylcarbamoyl adenosine modification protein (Sua5/YciO/YrdC/YwlC family)
MDERLVEEAVEAILAGRPVVLPTDTVYGLVTSPEHAAVLARLKGRDEGQPIALLAADVDALLELVPELPENRLRALLPGGLTVVLHDPARRFPALGSGTIGVRVPELTGEAREIVRRAGPVAATSANLHGEPDPVGLEDVPEQIRKEAVVVDGGVLPGIPSTVVDLTGCEARVVREGAVPAAEVFERLG